MSEEMIDLMIGLDKRKEIFSLWTEVIFLRKIVNLIINENNLTITPEQINFCLDSARKETINKFPTANIYFEDKKIEEETES